MGYVKGRDKKIKDLERLIHEKTKEVDQKKKLEEIMKDTLNETEAVFLTTKEKLEKAELFISKI